MTNARPSVAERTTRSLDEIRADIESHTANTPYSLVGFGPNSVGVQGDSRVVGPVVILTAPPSKTMLECGEFATRLINVVKGITRVLYDIAPQ